MLKTKLLVLFFIATAKLAVADCILSCSISGDSACIYATAVGQDCEKSGPISLYFYDDKEEGFKHELENLSINVPKAKKQIIKQIKPIPVNAKSCTINWSHGAL